MPLLDLRWFPYGERGTEARTLRGRTPVDGGEVDWTLALLLMWMLGVRQSSAFPPLEKLFI